MKKQIMPKTRTYFIKVQCPSCGNEQTIFSAAASTVKCLVCNHVLAESGASKIKLKAKIVKELR